jgi:general secretion pathway protein A
MYTDWFKLKKLPFRLRPDPEFVYLADSAGIGYAGLRAALTAGKKLVCLLGEAGVGKTTLLHTLARDCQPSMNVFRIQQPNLTSQELAATLAEQIGAPPQDDKVHEPLASLKRHITSEAERGRAALILVDEAHHCASSLLRELLLLAAWPTAPLIVLAGEEGLSKALDSLETSTTAVPAITTLRLVRLTQGQIGGYLNHRLRIAGSEGREVFEADTIGEIFRYTGGTPQLINTLCDSAMMFAESHSVARVGTIEIRDAARELNWIEFSARSALSGALADSQSSARNRAPPSVTLGLEVRRKDQFVSQLALAPGSLVVGRGADVGLHLDSLFVSRKHCRLVTTAEQTVIEDLGSANGLFVNGHRCQLYRLAPGDKIVLSDYTLTCINTDEPPAA